MIRRFGPTAVAALIIFVACTDLIGPRGGDSVRLVIQPSFGQVPTTALADNPASRVDNVHVLLRNAAGTVVLDTIVEWPLNQDTLRMEMDVVVQERETFELTLQGRSGDQLLFQAGPMSLELSDDDEGSTVETSPVLEYAGPGAEVLSVEITGAPESFLAGSVVEFGAVGANDDGSEADELIIVWTSLDPNAAAVDDDGRVQVGHDASRAVSIEARVAFTTITDTVGGSILPAELTVSPDASTLTALGAELSLSASLLGEDGGDVTGLPIEWSVADPSVLEVAADGDAGTSAVATALIPGATRVIATAGELADTADVAVEQAVARLEAEPDSAILERVGANVQASASAFDGNDHEVDDASVEWSSDAADVARVAEDGTITAVSPGTTWIIATSEEAADSVRVTVLNVAPELTITAPSDGATFEEGNVITFEGVAEDLEDGDLSGEIEWVSDNPGELGTGASVSAELEPGDHTVTASVTDADGATSSASITVTVKPNTPPTVNITAPEEAMTVSFGTEVTLEGEAADEQDGDLSGSIEWSSDLDGKLGAGPSVAVDDLSIGSHTITASVSDSRDLTASASRALEVTNNAPVVKITAPADGATYDEGENITFEGAADDVEDGDLIADIVWSLDTDGRLGRGASVTVGLSKGTHTITATVTDSHGETAAAFVEVTVNPNTAPTVSITSPSEAITVKHATEVTLEGAADDEQDGDLSESIQWSSDLDGKLGTGASMTTSGLSIGSHTITAEVVDSRGTPGKATVGIEVALPNLVLADLVVDASEPLVSGDTVRLTAEIVNVGGAESAAADVVIRVLDGANEAVVAEVLQTIPALAADETLSLVVDLSEADLEGDSELEVEGDSILFEVEIDPDDAIAETDETDNAGRSRPFAVAVVDLPPGVTSGWVGRSSDWQDPSNWFPDGVPTAEDVVLVAASADAQPVLTADVTIGGLTIEDGATLDVNGHTLTVTGSLDAGNTIVDGTGGGTHPAVVMTGEGALRGTVPHLLITGQVGAAGTVQVMSDLEVAGEGAEFHVGQHVARVGDDLLVRDGGTIQMHHVEGVLDVADNVELSSSGGASSVAAAGLLVVGSDFRATVVTGDGPAFFGTGTHRTIMAGTGPGATHDGAIEIDAADGSSFQHLELLGEFDVAFVGGVATVVGDLAVAMDGALAADDLFVFGGLTAASESTVGVGRLHLRGALEVAAGDGFLVDEIFFAGDGQVIQPGLPYKNVAVFGRAALGGTTTVAEALHVAGEGAELTVGPHQLTVGPHFTTASGGILRMEHADGVLDLNGFGGFAGGESVLTAGTIRVAGDLLQGSDAEGNGNRAFRAGPGLLTVFDGSGTQTIEMHDPGPPDGDFSFFGTLEVANTGGGLFMRQDVHATGALVVPAVSAPSIFGDAFTLNVGALDVDGLTLDKTPLVVRAGPDAPMRFDNVAFQAYDEPSDPTQLRLFHPGAADPFAFNNIVFDTHGADGETSFLIDATDTQDDGATLTIDLIDPTDEDETPLNEANAGHLTREAGGAVVNWPGFDLPDGVDVGWTGAVSDDWSEAANWTPAPPTSEDVVLIPEDVPHHPVLTGAAAVGGLIVEPGASLDLASYDLTVTGDLDAGGTITNSESTSGRVVMSGVEMTVRGTLPELHIIDGDIFTAGDVHVTANLSIGGAGSLAVGPHHVTADFDMSVVDGGLLFMDDVDAVVDVAQDVSFHSTQTSTPSAGTLLVGGDFYAGVALEDPSFSAKGTHRTVLHGTGPQAIDIDVGGFQDLQISSGGSVTSSSVFVRGELNITEPVTFSAIESTVTVRGDVITALSSDLTIFSLFVGGDLLVSGGFDVFATTFTGTDQSIPALPYEHVNVHGTAFLADNMQISGNLFVGHENASSPSMLDISDVTLEVGGDFHVQPANGSVDPAANSGALVMQHSGSILDIQGNTFFEGGESVLTQGTIRIGGDFSQDSDLSGVTNNFAAAPNLGVVLDGGDFQSVDFMDPDESHFGTLELANYSSGGVFLGTNVFASGGLIAKIDSETEASPRVEGGGNSLTVTGLDVGGLVLYNAPLVTTGGDILRGERMVFDGFTSNVVQLTIEHPGAPEPITLNDLTFHVAAEPDGIEGFYLRAVDTAASDGTDLTIDLFGTTPLNGSELTVVEPVQQTVVNWPG